MDPRTQFCHNHDCRTRGKEGKGNQVIHNQVIHSQVIYSQKEKRYKCTLCDATFSETKGATPFFRLKTARRL